jgi:hypothetical protein
VWSALRRDGGQIDRDKVHELGRDGGAQVEHSQRQQPSRLARRQVIINDPMDQQWRHQVQRLG